MRKLRRAPAIFKGDFGNRLIPLLDYLESSRLKQGVSDLEEGSSAISYKNYIKLLESLISSRSRNRAINGIPLHFPFTEVQDIVSKVEATGIHSNKHPDVEFVLAVRVYPYCNNVMSVRVFVGTFSPC